MQTVGEVSTLSGLLVRMLHHNDELGLLLPSERSEASDRLYASADVERLRAIAPAIDAAFTAYGNGSAIKETTMFDDLDRSPYAEEARLAELMAAEPAGGEAAAEAHRDHLARWFHPCPPAMHRGLAEMDVADPRFAAHYDERAPRGHLRSRRDRGRARRRQVREQRGKRSPPLGGGDGAGLPP